MTERKTLSTVYVAGEGAASIRECMAATFEHCREHAVDVIVIYTATGDGPCIALDEFRPRQEYAGIRLVAVTPPQDKVYIKDPRAAPAEFTRTGISGERRKLLRDAKVQIVSARFPFRSLFASDGEALRPTTMDPIQLVDRSFGILGGGFSFCVQASMIACDAGAVKEGQRIAVMSADTALVLYACQSESFLSPTFGMIVEHIICRPTLYNISKMHHFLTTHPQEAASVVQTELPLVDSEPHRLPEGEQPADASKK